MSADLQLPLDFERTHEFRLLVKALREKVAANVNLAEKSIEASAAFLYLRLFVELAFLARTTNRPGYLTKSGQLLYEASLEPLFGPEDSAVETLRQALILRQFQSGDEGDLYCETFARLNSHFAGNYVNKERKGNVLSLYERQKKNTAQEALQQSLALDRAIFRKRDGGEMAPSEIQRAMIFVKTLDNALGLSRSTKEYSESLIADAFDVSSKYAREPEVLRNVYLWIMQNRTNPALPKTTEQILACFDAVEKATRQ